jgi:hypothetical protein
LNMVGGQILNVVNSGSYSLRIDNLSASGAAVQINPSSGTTVVVYPHRREAEAPGGVYPHRRPAAPVPAAAWGPRRRWVREATARLAARAPAAALWPHRREAGATGGRGPRLSWRPPLPGG